jgi:predicted PolB exonuclease-like 3'-5' exonuclease
MSTPSYLILDIETIPDRELHTPPDPAAGTERPFPPLYACKPVVIGVMWFDADLGCRKIGTIGEGKDEGGMMQDFADFMASRKPHLVTWNGRAFDLPVLTLRALRFGISLPWYYQDRDYRYRYSVEGHLDLCDFLADHGAARMTSLDGAARLIGLPGKGGVDGSQVEGLHSSGQFEALRRYCLADVAQTAFLFLRYHLLVGQIDRAQYQRVATAALATFAADERTADLAGRVDQDRLLLR